MSITRRHKKSLAVRAANKIPSANWGVCGKFWSGMIISAASNRCIISLVRLKKKILAMRQQIAKGKYDFDRRLDVVVDRLLDKLNT